VHGVRQVGEKKRKRNAPLLSGEERGRGSQIQISPNGMQEGKRLDPMRIASWLLEGKLVDCAAKFFWSKKYLRSWK